jgi:hypothetical protein
MYFRGTVLVTSSTTFVTFVQVTVFEAKNYDSIDEVFTSTVFFERGKLTFLAAA